MTDIQQARTGKCTKKTPAPLLGRREVLLMGATGAVTLIGLGFRSQGKVFAQNAATVITTPALEEGPYWVDETGINFFRSDLRGNVDGTNVQAGLPLHLALNVSQYNPTTGAVTPLPNAFVYLWHCSALGLYSYEAAEDTASDTYLRGYQVTSAHGSAHYLTNYPGWYSGRTVHIHARIRLYPNNDPTQTPTYDFETQMFFDDSVSDHVIQNFSPYATRPNRDTINTTDRVYTGASLDADGVTSNAGALTQLRLADDTTYAIASFNMVLNLALAETTGSGGGGTGSGGGPGPGGGTGPGSGTGGGPGGGPGPGGG